MDLQSTVALSILPGISRIRAPVFRIFAVAGLTASRSKKRSRRAPGRPRVGRRHRPHGCRGPARRRRGRGIHRPREDDHHPPLLRTIADPPPVCGYGETVGADPAGVAIVGSRAATPYALEVAARLAGELADRRMLVVSGLARGADGAAHRGCLAAGGATVGVLGCGPDIIYPPEHRELAASLCREGALVSELGPGAPPLPEHFPPRNRLISGLSVAGVVGAAK